MPCYIPVTTTMSAFFSIYRFYIRTACASGAGAWTVGLGREWLRALGAVRDAGELTAFFGNPAFFDGALHCIPLCLVAPCCCLPSPLGHLFSILHTLGP